MIDILGFGFWDGTSSRRACLSISETINTCSNWPTSRPSYRSVRARSRRAARFPKRLSLAPIVWRKKWLIQSTLSQTMGSVFPRDASWALRNSPYSAPLRCSTWTTSKPELLGEGRICSAISLASAGCQQYTACKGFFAGRTFRQFHKERHLGKGSALTPWHTAASLDASACSVLSL